MGAELNTTITTDIAMAQSIDLVARFNGGLGKLLEALGVTQKIPMSVGMKIKTYKTAKDVKTAAVAEGDVIPLSKVQLMPDKEYELTIDKYRKRVTGEAIQRSGFDMAVNRTDEELLKEIQKGIRTKLFDFLKTGTGTGKGKGLQAALAQCWGKVQTAFEDDGVNTIVFANPMDVADYIGGANITVQTQFGMTFITGFIGVTIITNTSVPKGTLYATAPENLKFAYIPAGNSEVAKVFDLTTDETGFIGVTHQPVVGALSLDTVMVTGATIFAERLDGVFKVAIEADTAAAGTGVGA